MNVPMHITINTPTREYERKGHMEIGADTVLQHVLSEFPDCTSMVIVLVLPEPEARKVETQG